MRTSIGTDTTEKSRYAFPSSLVISEFCHSHWSGLNLAVFCIGSLSGSKGVLLLTCLA